MLMSPLIMEKHHDKAGSQSAKGVNIPHRDLLASIETVPLEAPLSSSGGGGVTPFAMVSLSPAGGLQDPRERRQLRHRFITFLQKY